MPLFITKMDINFPSISDILECFLHVLQTIHGTTHSSSKLRRSCRVDCQLGIGQCYSLPPNCRILSGFPWYRFCFRHIFFTITYHSRFLFAVLASSLSSDPPNSSGLNCFRFSVIASSVLSCLCVFLGLKCFPIYAGLSVHVSSPCSFVSKRFLLRVVFVCLY